MPTSPRPRTQTPEPVSTRRSWPAQQKPEALGTLVEPRRRTSPTQPAASSLQVPEDSSPERRIVPTAFQAPYVTDFRGQTLWPETCDEDVLVPRRQEVETFPAGCGGRIPLPGSHHEGSSTIPLQLGLATLVLLRFPGKRSRPPRRRGHTSSGECPGTHPVVFPYRCVALSPEPRNIQVSPPPSPHLPAVTGLSAFLLAFGGVTGIMCLTLCWGPHP